ncbi:unnamed protein product [Rotaria sordida]|uniref:Uncharacterized protein n=2 Tax=Rotaria sordida TaxID=392033 RepID=A0A815GQL5_9BILA|nr:unnamed protein product [Rotaria sordida]
MLIMYVIILLALHNAVHTEYSLYYSDIRQSSYLTFDCLYTQHIDSKLNEDFSYLINKQLTPYCRRPDNDEKEEELSDILGENIANKISFNELRKQGITSEQLLNWSAPIDLAERYEMNNQSSELFYNCSSPWFGSKCQYRFIYNSSWSFNEIVESSAKNQPYARSGVIITTCYPFFVGCRRGPWDLCLDWRQICNGIVDCKNGEDEQWCETLEITTCADDEYRCHYGGQCIPLIFARDNYLIPDCLDGSEDKELYTNAYSAFTHSFCGSIRTFQCEERINRYPRSFPCGDGSFLMETGLTDTSVLCSNRRDTQVFLTMWTSFDHIKNITCQQAFRCSTILILDYCK